MIERSRARSSSESSKEAVSKAVSNAFMVNGSRVAGKIERCARSNGAAVG